MYNIVGSCDYSELGANVRTLKDQVICDTLIIRTNSEKARDKIIREGTNVTLDQVITILQTEDSMSRTEHSAPLQRACKYDQKKGSKGGKGPGQKKTPSSTRTPSTSQNCTPKSMHYVKYDQKKGSKGGKGPGKKKTPSSTRTPSTSRNGKPKLCFCCKKGYT